jgi:DNA polymerase-3 subunit delta'
MAAMAFARSLCCESAGPAGLACNACSTCKRIDRGVFQDVTEFNLARQAERDREKSKNLSLNVATVREISSAVSYRPGESRWRIIIVDNAETMQETAQEAFLKTLEEPPSYAVILLLATDVEAILPTILSRSTVVRFGATPVDDIRRALELAEVESSMIDRLSAVAGGSIDWAFQAASDRAKLEAREAEIGEALQFIVSSDYDRMIRAITLADVFSKDRDSLYSRLDVLRSVWRAAMYARFDLGEGLGVHDLSAFSEVDAREIVGAIQSIDTCISNLEANVRPRLAVESMVLSWPRLAR